MDNPRQNLPKRHRVEGNTQRWFVCTYTCPCHCSLGLQKQASETWVTKQTLSWPTLLLGLLRGEKREKVRIGNKKRGRPSSSLLVLEMLAFFRAVAFSQAHIIQSNLPSVTTPFFTFEDDALDVSPSQGDLCLPPAMATISSPQGCSVDPMFSHKHLECACVQPRHLVPEGQAQVPWMHEVAER